LGEAKGQLFNIVCFYINTRVKRKREKKKREKERFFLQKEKRARDSGQRGFKFKTKEKRVQKGDFNFKTRNKE